MNQNKLSNQIRITWPGVSRRLLAGIVIGVLIGSFSSQLGRLAQPQPAAENLAAKTRVDPPSPLSDLHTG